MNIGDTVIYLERGEQYVATVLGVRELEHHSGKDDQPLLHLGFFAPVHQADATGKLVPVSVVGTHRQDQLTQFRVDVAHDSHEFPEELKAPRYPGGRWVEAVVAFANDQPAEVEAPVVEKKKKKSEPSVQ